ncbi:g8526 [Coccomyxa elongata]
MAANGADAEQASCLANSRHPAFIGDSAPTWLLNQSYSVPDWEGSIPTFTQVLAELDKPQPFSLAAWAAGTGRTTAAPQPDPLRGSAAGPSCSQEARSIADVGRQGKQKIADQPCFQSAEVATPDNCSQSAELSVAVAQGSPVRQPAAAEPQKTVQLLSVLQRQHLRPQPSISASTGKENHGSNGRRATLFSQNTLAGRLKATSSCGYSRAAPLQHAHSSTREDAACRGSTVEGDAVTPGPAGHHEHALGCASSSPGWHNSRVQHDRVRLDGGTTGRSALQHASSVLDEQHGGGLDARRRSMSEPHKSESGGEGGQCDTPYEISRMGNPRSFASSVPAQHASISNAAQSHGFGANQTSLHYLHAIIACLLSPGGLQRAFTKNGGRMSEVYVNEFPGPFGLREDGRLSFAPLELYPASIKIQGVLALVEPDGTTERSWTSLLQFLIDHGRGTKDLGTQANPLQVAGIPMSGHRPGAIEDGHLSQALDRLEERVETLQARTDKLGEQIEADLIEIAMRDALAT